MPDKLPQHRFVPPYWPPATRDPSFLELFRSPSITLLGWSRSVYEGGCHQAKLPGAVLVIGDADVAASILFELAENFPHGVRLAVRIGGFVADGGMWMKPVARAG